jgi:hypothetical protein
LRRRLILTTSVKHKCSDTYGDGDFFHEFED